MRGTNDWPGEKSPGLSCGRNTSQDPTAFGACGLAVAKAGNIQYRTCKIRIALRRPKQAYGPWLPFDRPLRRLDCFSNIAPIVHTYIHECAHGDSLFGSRAMVSSIYRVAKPHRQAITNKEADHGKL
jgi:hypothetical protein